VGLSEGVSPGNDYNRSGPEVLLYVVRFETGFKVFCLANVSHLLGVTVISTEEVVGGDVIGLCSRCSRNS
jgi:hypothetical protein